MDNRICAAVEATEAVGDDMKQLNEVQIPVPGIDTSAADLTDAQRTLIRAGLLRGSAQTAWVLERMLTAAQATDDRLREALDDALERIEAWANAYPEDVFPAPDWEEVKRLLGDTLLTRVSAANMRHVATGMWKHLGPVRAALASTAPVANDAVRNGLVMLAARTEGEARAIVEVLSCRLGYGHVADLSTAPVGAPKVERCPDCESTDKSFRGYRADEHGEWDCEHEWHGGSK